MMITLEDAWRLVNEKLKEMELTAELSALMISNYRTEDFGWTFFYDTEAFLLNGDQSEQLAGNSPLLVDKYTGLLHLTGTAQPIDFYINIYKARMGYN